MLLPAQPADGYLWVAIADVTGNLFNLLPNLGRPDAAVASNGTVEGDTRRVRVAFDLADAKADPKARPYFKVDDTFGKSLMIVFRSDRPLFDTLRPTTETVASFIQDLEASAAGRAGADSRADDAGYRVGRLRRARSASQSAPANLSRVGHSCVWW